MNKVVHFEIPAKDASKMQKFYGDVFGWKFNKVSMPEGDYHIINTGPTDDKGMTREPGFINGGMSVDDETAEGPVVVVDVSMLDEHLKKIELAGGEVIMPKQKVGDMGFYARIKDPEGNVIGVWQNVMKMD